MLKKEFGNQQDPLVYQSPTPNNSLAQDFYVENCQKYIEDYLVAIYTCSQQEWVNFDTPTYVEKALAQLGKDQALLERYFPLSVRKILDSL